MLLDILTYLRYYLEEDSLFIYTILVCDINLSNSYFRIIILLQIIKS